MRRIKTINTIHQKEIHTQQGGSRALPPSQTKISYTQAKSHEQIINKFPKYFLATIETFFPAMPMDALFQGYRLHPTVNHLDLNTQLAWFPLLGFQPLLNSIYPSLVQM